MWAFYCGLDSPSSSPTPTTANCDPEQVHLSVPHLYNGLTIILILLVVVISSVHRALELPLAKRTPFVQGHMLQVKQLSAGQEARTQQRERANPKPGTNTIVRPQSPCS